MYRSFAGMQVHFVSRKNGRGVWCYAEKGAPAHHHRHHKHHHRRSKHPTLVFLHGFGGDKDTWPSMIKFIPTEYHCKYFLFINTLHRFLSFSKLKEHQILIQNKYDLSFFMLIFCHFTIAQTVAV